MFSIAEDTDHTLCDNPNELASERSPYLRMHSCDPIRWRAWNERSLREAKERQLPIFLSIGYSSCHWCHVMHKESFKDPEVAEILNRYFIPIKVDREEFPDIDDLYMTSVIMVTGSGGWPLNVFLTPDLKPFYGGTYFPRDTFIDLLHKIVELWRSDRDRIYRAADEIFKAVYEYTRLSQGSEVSSARGVLDRFNDLFEKAYVQIGSQFDPEYGGFGYSMKFPMIPSNLFLARYWFRRGERVVGRILTKTADSMIRYGLHDHLLGGFFRYTVDRAWRVPHFEKMLYDNALIARFLIEIFRLTGNSEYLVIAKRTVDFMINYMLSKNGFFSSAIDADSGGEEGGFYLFHEHEIYDALGKELGDIAKIIYGYSPNSLIDGKFHLVRELDVYGLSKRLGVSVDEAAKIYSEIEYRLARYRLENKKHPFIDTKALTDWNMLAVVSLAELYACTGNTQYRDLGSDILRKTINNLFDGARVSHVVYPDGEISKHGYLEDIAGVAEASIHMYMATFESRYLQYAEDLVDVILSSWLTGDRVLNVSPVSKFYGSYTYMDSPTPSGVSIAANVLSYIYLYTGNREYKDRVKDLAKKLDSYLYQSPSQFSYLMLALDNIYNPSYQIAITCRQGREVEARKFIDEIYGAYMPRVVGLWKGEYFDSRILREFFKGKSVTDSPTYYICYGSRCYLPLKDPDEATKALYRIRNEKQPS